MPEQIRGCPSDVRPTPTQGSQFTSAGFVAVLTAAVVAISMDGKRAWRDNIFGNCEWSETRP